MRLQSQIPKAQYGGRHAVTMLPGAGIGPELMQHVADIFKFAGCPIDFEVIQVDKHSPDEEMEYATTSIKRNGVAIKGMLRL